MGLMLAFFLATFGILTAFHVRFLEDPTAWMSGRGGWVAAVTGVGLLIADVFLPVPSSLVMIAHGALFGVTLGTVLSLVGSVGATLFGFAVGRRGGPTLARLVSAEEKVRADALLAKWGALAILITRPIPLMAETVSILAGASPMGWGKMTLAAFAGSAPMALLYALTGATTKGFANGFLMFGVVILIAGIFWFLAKKAG
ncbi:MAG: associated Golgi protein-related protein [Fibrobacteres bacterium]|nr:associated Golgi protein-related protein [Fibrobacterota bacterium]